jgi:hypothetical protein
MSFFAAGSALAVGLGATAGGVAATAAGLGASYLGSKAVNKLTSGSSSGSVGSLPNSQLDIDKIITDARTTAAENYKNSLALERANNPGQAAFREAATQAAVASAERPSYTGSPTTNSLLNESAESILSQLRLGSALPADVQAQVTRAALSKAGQAGLAGSFAGRGLVAQDIGTTSLALQQQRQAQALQAGSVLDQLGLARDQASRTGALQLKTLADSFALPESGLSPGSIASLYVGNNNVANQTAQNQFLIDQQNANNRNAQINQLLGFGSSVFANRNKGVLDIGTLPTTTVDVGYGK